MRLSTDQMRALRLLDEAEPRGCTEAILLAHGFKAELLYGLVRDGLARMAPESVRAGGRSVAADHGRGTLTVRTQGWIRANICYVTQQSPHPYSLKIRPCNEHVDRHRWEILDNEGLLQTSLHSFATEREAEDNGRLEMQGLIEMWNKL